MQISAQRLRPVGAINEERLGTPGNGLQIPPLVSCIRFKIADGHFKRVDAHGFTKTPAAECLQRRKIGQRRITIKGREIRRCAWLLVHPTIIADHSSHVSDSLSFLFFLVQTTPFAQTPEKKFLESTDTLRFECLCFFLFSKKTDAIGDHLFAKGERNLTFVQNPA